MPKVSIVIPIYNVEPYLRRCLESVVNQTLTDIEIICINDCSPDNSLSILREYAAGDSRITVIDFVQNKGVSVARNAGINVATGEYIGFVDSDDCIDLNFYEKLYERAKSADADVAKGGVLYVPKENKPYCDKSILNIKRNKAYFLCFFASAIYRRTFLQKAGWNGFQENVLYGEDRLLPATAAAFANKIEVVEEVAYHYLLRDNSATDGGLNDAKIKSFVQEIHNIIDVINSKGVADAETYAIIYAGLFHEVAYYFSKASVPLQKYVFDLMLDVYKKLPKEYILAVKKELVIVMDRKLFELLGKVDGNLVCKYLLRNRAKMLASPLVRALRAKVQQVFGR